jgi:hypothetical protein
MALRGTITPARTGPMPANDAARMRPTPGAGLRSQQRQNAAALQLAVACGRRAEHAHLRGAGGEIELDQGPGLWRAAGKIEAQDRHLALRGLAGQGFHRAAAAPGEARAIFERHALACQIEPGGVGPLGACASTSRCAAPASAPASAASRAASRADACAAARAL